MLIQYRRSSETKNGNEEIETRLVSLPGLFYFFRVVVIYSYDMKRGKKNKHGFVIGLDNGVAKRMTKVHSEMIVIIVDGVNYQISRGWRGGLSIIKSGSFDDDNIIVTPVVANSINIK